MAADRPAIAIDEVSYAYAGGAGEEVLRQVTLHSGDGEFFCLLGPSGCGKTTVLRLVAGFEQPTGGRIAVNGVPVTGAGVDRGVVFQGDDSLFTWLTAQENVAFGPRMRGVSQAERTRLAQHYLDLVGLHGQGHKYPGQMSGGMRQRIQIARVLANDPDILLMDEPFGALDAQTRTELQGELARIWGEMRKTVLFITHDITEALLLGDRVGVMRAGPASGLRAVIDVDLPRPRARSAPEFGQLYETINGMIAEEVRASRMRGGHAAG